MSETDMDLLARYARQNAEAAFAELVRRHLDLVFSAALRQVRSPQLAEEVAQSVFADLARRSGDLTPDTTLAAWLYQVTRRTAIDVVRRESRRQLREQIAWEMNAMNATTADWTRIEPLLDEAMEALEETDRTAILLRYFKNQSLREVGAALGTSDDAAQKRVSRAVERLREFFARHGVTVGAGGLAVIISTNAVQAAPVGLAAAITSFAATGAAVSTATLITATKTIFMTTFQKTLIAAVLAAAVGSGLYEAHQAAASQKQLQTLQDRQASLDLEVQRMSQEHDGAMKQLADLQVENAQLQAGQKSLELVKLRGEVTQMQNAANDPAATAAKAWLDKVSRLKQRFDASPGAKIPEMQLLTDQDWLNAAKGPLDTDAEYRRAFAELRSTAESKFVGASLKPAIDNYSQANGGKFPTSMADLQPFYPAPVDDAILARWEVVPASVVPNVGVGPQVITEKAAVDDLLDQRTAVGAQGYGSMDYLYSEIKDELTTVYKAYTAANGPGFANFTPAQLLPYATTPDQQAAVQKVIEQHALRN